MLGDDILEDLRLSSWAMALNQLQISGRIRPVLLLSGAGGEAIVQVGSERSSIATMKDRKMRLMATALAASTAGYVFETVLHQRGVAAMRVAGFLLRSHQQQHFRIARIGRRRSGEMVLAELHVGIAQPEGLRLPHDLDAAFEQDMPAREDRDRAWDLLREMGVELGSTNRTLN